MDEIDAEKLTQRILDFNDFAGAFYRKNVQKQEILLQAGDRATHLFIVLRGCLRQYFIKEDGSEITSQFFIEGQAVSSFESAFANVPSRSFIEAIEDSTILYIEIENFKKLIENDSAVKEFFTEYLKQRLITYINIHSSFILDSPEKRYINLMNEQPELLERIPQRHLATYLGITPVSLSRIRKRLNMTGKKE